MNGNQYEAPIPEVAPPPPAQANDSMRRLQIGVAGVLTVLLLVGMAGLIGDRAREKVAEDAAATEIVKMPGEEKSGGTAPLEELGVQPVSKESKDVNLQPGAKVPQAAPSVTVPDLEPDPALERARQSAK